MFEITYLDGDALDYYMSEGMAYPHAKYDFTFEKRFLIYHAPLRKECVYLVFDMETKHTSEAYRCSKPIKMLNPRDFIPYIYEAIKYTGDQRYLNNMVKDPMEVIDYIFRDILSEYGFLVRDDQIELSKRIFRGFSTYTASLCEAEVGTGKNRTINWHLARDTINEYCV